MIAHGRNGEDEPPAEPSAQLQGGLSAALNGGLSAEPPGGLSAEWYGGLSAALYRDALGGLSGWSASDPAQQALRADYVRHLESHPDGLSRTCQPDHLTASALVVSGDRTKVLLNLHRKYGIWVQFGGHFEPQDTTVAGAALREAQEESGIEGLVLASHEIAQLDTHKVRCGPISPAHHLDVRYVAVAPSDAEIVVSEESLDVRWFDSRRLPAGLEPEIHELIAIAGQL